MTISLSLKASHITTKVFHYKNEIQMPFVETIGTGEEAHQIVLTTPEELKEFLRDPTSGSLLVYSNQQEIKALANIFDIYLLTKKKTVHLSGQPYALTPV